MLHDSDKIAIALQILRKRHAIDAEALAAVLRDHHETSVLERAFERGIGSVCMTEKDCILAEVSAQRIAEARAMLIAERMGDLIGLGG